MFFLIWDILNHSFFKFDIRRVETATVGDKHGINPSVIPVLIEHYFLSVNRPYIYISIIVVLHLS